MHVTCIKFKISCTVKLNCIINEINHKKFQAKVSRVSQGHASTISLHMHTKNESTFNDHDIYIIHNCILIFSSDTSDVIKGAPAQKLYYSLHNEAITHASGM